MIDGIPGGIVDGKPPHDGGKSQTGAAGRRRKEETMDIELEIRARTPIWTACARPSAFVPSGHWPMWTDRPTAEEADGPFDRIRPDALLASMRWRFDAAMRALDQRVCDTPNGVRCGACVARLAALLALLERIGGIGMRLPEGYGAYAIADGGPLDAVIATASWPSPAARRRRVAADVLPDLRDVVIARCVIRPRVPGWWTGLAPIIPAARRVQPLAPGGMAPAATAVHAALERRTDLRRPARRAVFGALPPAARRARVAAPWAFRDDPPDDPAAPWRGPWRAHAAVWTGGLSAAVRARVESAVADPSLWGAALGDNADGEVSVARLDDADGVIQALRGGAPGAP